MALDTDPRDVPDHEADDDSDAAIVREAHRRFMRCEQWESEARSRWKDDYKFANGDALNNYQWPDVIYNARNGLQRPTLTINKARQLNLHIINEAKQKKSGIKFRPIGDGATAQAAEIWEGLARHIQNASRAESSAFGPAIEFQVEAGLGYTRIVTEFESDDSFNQEARIKGIPDPMSCYLDPDCTEPDGSDAGYGFVFSDKPRDLMEKKYPELKERGSPANSVDGKESAWLRDDHVREAEYYRVVEEKDELIGSSDGTKILRSEVPSDLLKMWDEEAEARGEKLKRRDVITRSVKWYKIVGDIIVDRTDCPNKTIPIIPWIGEQTIIDGKMDRKGHTRCLISAQQMLNYNRSAAVEFGALQSKTPYIAPAAAIEGYETYWESANTVNHAVLMYNHRDDEGREIPPPVRQQPPTSAPVYMEGAEAADKDMQLASGQYDAELGAPSNEKSGRAINERQRQAERATYHYTDNQGTAIRRHGEILLEIVPKIYDTARIIRIVGEDGEESHVHLDPMAPQAHQETQDASGAKKRTFNPNIGKYEVVSDVGPDYATQRQEAFDAIVQILTQAPMLIDRIGDLLFRVADFPLANEIAERLKPGLPPQAQQAIDALQKQLQEKNKLLGETMQALTEERLKVKAKDTTADVNAFKADTERTRMLLDAATAVDPAMAMEMIREMAQQAVRQAMQDNLGPVRRASAGDLSIDAEGRQLPGAAGQMPVRVPDVGQQAASPGGL